MKNKPIKVNVCMKNQAIKELIEKQGLEGPACPYTHYEEENNYEIDGQEYLIVNEEEKEKELDAYIRSSIWAFKASFLSGFLNIEEKHIKTMQEAMNEDCNDIFLKLLNNDLSWFIQDAVKVDGAGHFLSGYDGNEIELEGNFFAYRTNQRGIYVHYNRLDR